MTPTSTYQVCNLGVCGISPNFELPLSLYICIVCTCVSSHFQPGIFHRIMAASLWEEEEHHQSKHKKLLSSSLIKVLLQRTKKFKKVILVHYYHRMTTFSWAISCARQCHLTGLPMMSEPEEDIFRSRYREKERKNCKNSITAFCSATVPSTCLTEGSTPTT